VGPWPAARQRSGHGKKRLAERGGKTLLRTVSAFQSVADRDAMVASGMERGVHDSGERLGELLARLQAS
jgi:hypothetical protein